MAVIFFIYEHRLWGSYIGQLNMSKEKVGAGPTFVNKWDSSAYPARLEEGFKVSAIESKSLETTTPLFRPCAMQMPSSRRFPDQGSKKRGLLKERRAVRQMR